ncbi:hypothetical protein TNIN_372741 [Trichonephila inaurata madagascariensis]|uniref:Uncharacterized protein n=1 Tax=Trichonephila inaurata madagascariensis TaxID=2747483 RepID=A0A8X6WV06_9ARAC|nr:hypothetical protein TNIN_372741 [Trichonephila inaurata madagascariensis]
MSAHPRPVRSLIVQVKAQSASSSVGKRTSDEQKGGEKRYFSTCVVPCCEIRGSIWGVWRRTELLRGSPSTFPDVRGQVEDIILGNEAQN